MITDPIGSSVTQAQLRATQSSTTPPARPSQDQLQQAGFQGPPPGGVDFSASVGAKLMTARDALSTEGQDELDAYMGDIFEQLRSGEFDAASAAENAPDELKAYAEANGLDLEELFTQLGEEHEKLKSMGPPGYDAQGQPTSFDGSQLPDLMGLLSDEENA